MRPMIALAVLAAVPTVALAQAAPKGTTPIPAAEIKEMFSGKTYNFSEKGHKGEKEAISWYLGVDGKMLGYTGNGPSHAAGTWSTSDGKLCVSDQWTGGLGNEPFRRMSVVGAGCCKPEGSLSRGAE
ncbi:DUF995 domain-containing protein [Rhizobium sp. CF142]|uniref:DUF995 domain-containing protein n=1 Tax=Rhizobium sp. CF142 TaxID=1144314 RepID=UPI00026EFFA1|nr:DUF995 domain-containing protein [Rhizobium sp. CF142]EJJ26234.1 Protein of unknown function (DUF995) [Rhizobium sp. CF142]